MAVAGGPRIRCRTWRAGGSWVGRTAAATGNRVGPSGLWGGLREWTVSEESRVTTRGGRWGRRRVLALGLGGGAAVIAGGVIGVELVSRGVLPGKAMLDR